MTNDSMSIWSKGTTLCLSLVAEDVLEDEESIKKTSKLMAHICHELDSLGNNQAKLHAAAWIAEAMWTDVEEFCSRCVEGAKERGEDHGI